MWMSGRKWLHVGTQRLILIVLPGCLVTQSKSYTRGFQSTLLFKSEMMQGHNTANVRYRPIVSTIGDKTERKTVRDN